MLDISSSASWARSSRWMLYAALNLPARLTMARGYSLCSPRQSPSKGVEFSADSSHSRGCRFACEEINEVDLGHDADHRLLVEDDRDLRIVEDTLEQLDLRR